MSEEEARLMEAERARPMPSATPASKSLKTVTDHVLHYAEGSLLEREHVARAMRDLCEKFRTKNWVKALADYGEALENRPRAAAARRAPAKDAR